MNVKTNYYILCFKEKYKKYTESEQNSGIQIFWIPSHRGIAGNEAADQLAKQATNKVSAEISQVPYTDFFQYFQEEAKNQTEEMLHEFGTICGKLYFQYFVTKKKKPWFIDKKLPRAIIVTVNRIRANHYNLAASLARVGIVKSAKCKCEEGDENINHVIWQCKLYDEERSKFYTNLRKLKYQLPMSVEMIVARPDIQACKFMYSFLEQCNIRI